MHINLISIVFTFLFFSLQMDMIHSEHYPAERHTVYTRDGYILTVYRIPNMNMNVQQNNRKVILFMHGTIHSDRIYSKRKQNKKYFKFKIAFSFYFLSVLQFNFVPVYRLHLDHYSVPRSEKLSKMISHEN